MLSLDGAQQPPSRAVHPSLPVRGGSRPARIVHARRPAAWCPPSGPGGGEPPPQRRRAAGPGVMAQALGLGARRSGADSARYDGIVAAVQARDAPGGAAAFGDLAASLREVIARPGDLHCWPRPTGRYETEAVSNAAVLMFGGIETTGHDRQSATVHFCPTGTSSTRSSPPRPGTSGDRGVAAPGTLRGGGRSNATADTALNGAASGGDQVTCSIAARTGVSAVARRFGRPPSETPGAVSGLRLHGPRFHRHRLARLEARIAIEAPCWTCSPVCLDPRATQRTPRPGFRRATRAAGALENMKQGPLCNV